MRYLTLAEILAIHERVLSSSGGLRGVRDYGALESAVAQPRLTFAEQDLYPDIESKACAICFSLVQNHPFIDGNKRVGHAAMETFLLLNGHEIEAGTDDQEHVMLDLASGTLNRQDLLAWVRVHIIPSGRER